LVKLIHNEQTLSLDDLNATEQSEAISLNSCLASGIFQSPDSKSPLHFDSGLSDGEFTYPIISGCPVLLPKEILSQWNNFQIPLNYTQSGLTQYALLNQMKANGGAINSDHNSLPSKKHYYRMHSFCKNLKGSILDIGCDSPAKSKLLFPKTCSYLGLDPSVSNTSEFKIIGMGEVLPFQDESFDNIIFNTSLDHILDYRLAIEESHRVLRTNGTIVISSYAWLYNTSLLQDTVHFHHFSAEDLTRSLSISFNTTTLLSYECPKHDKHRYGLYIKAVKK
jgi:SAM-dependent methyltransferase